MLGGRKHEEEEAQVEDPGANGAKRRTKDRSFRRTFDGPSVQS